MQLPKAKILTAPDGGHLVKAGDMVGLKPEQYAAHHYAVEFIRGAVAGAMGEVSVVRANMAFAIPARQAIAVYKPESEAAPQGTAKRRSPR